MEGYVRGALRKELHIAPFVECFQTATLGKSHRYFLPILPTEHFKTATLVSLPDKSYQCLEKFT